MRIHSLTLYRFTAAFFVVFFHFGRDTSLAKHVFFSGTVIFFFVLSGYVLTLAYFERDVPFWAYFRSRFYRIAPTYFFALITMLFVIKEFSAVSLFLSASFLQAWFPPHSLKLNIPSWSISVEMFLYLIFPLILFFIKAKKAKPVLFMFFSLLFWLFVQIVATNLWIYKSSAVIPEEFMNHFPPWHLSSFLLGMAGAYFYLSMKDKKPSLFLIWAGLVFSLLLTYVVLDESTLLSKFLGLALPIRTGIYSPVFLALILFSSFAERLSASQWLNNPVFVFLGDVSYAVFLFQHPVHIFYIDRISPLLHADISVDFYIYLVLLIFFSFIVNKYFEKPLRRWFFRLTS